MIKYDPYAHKAWQERQRLDRESTLTGLSEEFKVGSLKQAAASRRRDYSQQLRDETPTGTFKTVAKVREKKPYQPPQLKKKVNMSGMMTRWAQLGHMKKF